MLVEKLRQTHSNPIQIRSINTSTLSLIHPLSLCDCSNSIACVLQAVVENTYFLDCQQYPLSNPSIASELSSILLSKGIRVIDTNSIVHSVWFMHCVMLYSIC